MESLIKKEAVKSVAPLLVIIHFESLHHQDDKSLLANDITFIALSVFHFAII